MRDKFFKWLKRFFIVLPLIMLILQIIFSMGSFWRDNDALNWEIGDDDFIQKFVLGGNWNANELSNPLLFEIDGAPQGIYDIIQYAFSRLWGYIYADNLSNSYVNNMINEPAKFSYFLILINFLTWWMFIELMFLCFRFITFLISWVNSLFDKCFNKINKE